jgi:hypothetical protein
MLHVCVPPVLLFWGFNAYRVVSDYCNNEFGPHRCDPYVCERSNSIGGICVDP